MVSERVERHENNITRGVIIIILSNISANRVFEMKKNVCVCCVSGGGRRNEIFKALACCLSHRKWKFFFDWKHRDLMIMTMSASSSFCRQSMMLLLLLFGWKSNCQTQNTHCCCCCGQRITINNQQTTIKILISNYYFFSF